MLASVQAVIGPGGVDTIYFNGQPCHLLRGQHRGRPVDAAVQLHQGTVVSIRFGAPLGGRPITLLLNHRHNTTILGVPEVRTGDPEFDQLFLLNGFPVEVLRELMDPSTRDWLLARYRTADPPLGTRDGALTLGVPLRMKDGLWSLPGSRPLPPPEVADWLDALVAMADRLASSFDGLRDAMARAQGPAAADQWVRYHVDAMVAR